MIRVFLLVPLALAAARADAATVDGNAIVLRSTGQAAGNAWVLDRNGYVGTYINLAQPGNVTINVDAEGSSNPAMNVSIADANASFLVAGGAHTYSHVFSLPAGTHFLRTELNNDRGTSGRQLKINRLNVTGATLLNENSNANALAASDTYIANYRRGDVIVDLSSLGVAAGAKVAVRLQRIAFDFGAGVHGSGPGVDPQLGNDGTTEQTNYQRYLNQNFNTIVTSGAGFWNNNEPTRGDVTMSDVDQLYQYARAHNMHSRLHAMLFEYSDPSWVTSLKTAAAGGSATAKSSLTDAIASRNGYYVGNKNSQYNEIDLYNESYTSGETGGSDTYWNLYGANGIADFYHNAAQSAAGAGYQPKLFVNDGDALSDPQFANGYIRNIESLRQAAVSKGYGDVVGGIGLQFYEKSLRADLAARFMANLQNLNVQGLPTELTEFGTFSSVTPDDSAAILQQAMRLIFGNSSSTGFINWDWTKEDGGGDQWAPNAALYTVSTAEWNDFSLTPAGKVWQDTLGIADWDGNPDNGWNTQLTATVGADGKIRFNGYYGDYEFSVGGKTFGLTLTKGTTNYSYLSGDYDHDGNVSAADYSIWRNSFGQRGIALPADGNGDGIVDRGDYALWKTNFDSTAVGAAGNVALVPEHSTAALLGTGSLVTSLITLFLRLPARRRPRLLAGENTVR